MVRLRTRSDLFPASLSPASPVALAFVIDRERVDRWQSVGMAVAVGALVLVTLGR